MPNPDALVCDGCGQAAHADHIAKRLQRLEWTTRYRPIHISTLLLGAASPDSLDDFLYSPHGPFQGEAANALDVAGISLAGKTREAIHAEFQRAGFFLTHALECPVEPGGSREEALAALLPQRVSQVVIRIRRSLKPKRVVLIAKSLNRVADQFSEEQLGCPVIYDGQQPFALDGALPAEAIRRLRTALSASSEAGR
jgi:hypothetical protein